MLFFLTSLALADTTTKPCHLTEPVPSLPQYVGISQTIAAKGGGDKSVLYATAPDPQFDFDKPLEYRFTPGTSPTLTIVLVHHEAVVVGKGPVEIVEIQDLLVIDLSGNVTGGHRCEVLVAMTEIALRKMQEVYGF